MKQVSAIIYLIVVLGSCGGVVCGNVSRIVSVTLAASDTPLFAVGLFDVYLAELVGGTPAIGSSVFVFVMDKNWGCVEGNFLTYIDFFFCFYLTPPPVLNCLFTTHLFFFVLSCNPTQRLFQSMHQIPAGSRCYYSCCNIICFVRNDIISCGNDDATASFAWKLAD